MPRTPPAIPDPVGNSTIGLHMAFTRRAAGAAGVEGVYVYPPDPSGPFIFDVSQLSPANQTALVAILNEVTGLYRTARNYV